MHSYFGAGVLLSCNCVTCALIAQNELSMEEVGKTADGVALQAGLLNPFQLYSHCLYNTTDFFTSESKSKQGVGEMYYVPGDGIELP